MAAVYQDKKEFISQLMVNLKFVKKLDIHHQLVMLNKDELMKHYYYDYIEQSKDDCTHCWASKLCPLCFSNCYDENGFNLTAKKNDCTRVKNFVKDCLIIYHELLEKNPELLVNIIKSADV